LCSMYRALTFAGLSCSETSLHSGHALQVLTADSKIRGNRGFGDVVIFLLAYIFVGCGTTNESRQTDTADGRAATDRQKRAKQELRDPTQISRLRRIWSLDGLSPRCQRNASPCHSRDRRATLQRICPILRLYLVHGVYSV